MAYDIFNIKGKKVYTGFLSTCENHLEEIVRENAIIYDLYFFQDNEDKIEEKVLYDLSKISKHEIGIALVLKDNCGYELKMSIKGLDNIGSIFSDLSIRPESIASAIGRIVYAYIDNDNLYGIYIPVYDKDRRVG
jgi:hypothetical protein